MQWLKHRDCDMKKNSMEVPLTANRDHQGVDSRGKRELFEKQKGKPPRDRHDHSVKFAVLQKIANVLRSNWSVARDLLNEVGACLTPARRRELEHAVSLVKLVPGSCLCASTARTKTTRNWLRTTLLKIWSPSSALASDRPVMSTMSNLNLKN